MFLLEDRPVPYSDPWNTPVSTRLAALEKGTRRVVYYYEMADYSTFRYRVYNMVQALGEAGQGIAAAFFTEGEIARLEEVVERIDVLVICRARYTDRLNQVITQARRRGVRVFFDVDDLIFDVAYAHLLVATLDKDYRDPNLWDFWFAYIGRIGATLRLCDSVIVTNDYLAARVRTFADKPVSVLPNFLNAQQIAISENIFEQKRKSGFKRSRELHLGYFSGTRSHNRDFGIIAEMLAETLARDPRIRVRVVGFLDLKDSLRAFKSRVESFPLQDFVNLQRLIGSVEVNLVPLQDNIFTNCKSELKYFEAAVAGTLSVASPTFAFAGAMRDGENGYLAHSFEWGEKVETLINHMDSYPTLAENAFEHAMRNYHWRAQVEPIVKVLFP